jgi:phosphoglycerate dehydrogenase-like enzyme
MAEWCIGRIVAHERNFLVSHSDQLSGQWAASKSVFEYRYLSEMTLTVLGSTGDIGKCIGKAAKAFGMNVVGYSRSGGRDGDDETCFDEQVTDLTTALQAADYIVAVLPSTDATRGLLTLDKLQTANAEAGGRSPVLINVGRGDLVSSETLTRALDEGHLSAVILDVMDPEPLPPDSPLWKHPKVTISPHVSALTRGKDVPKVILQQYKHYCHAVAQNEDNKIGKDSISAMTAIASSLNYVVDWNKGY